MNSCIVSELILPSAQTRTGEEDQGGRQWYTHARCREHKQISVHKKYFKEIKKKKCCGGMDICGQINWVINWTTDEELEWRHHTHFSNTELITRLKEHKRVDRMLWSMRVGNYKNCKISRKWWWFMNRDTHLGSPIGSATQVQGGVCREFAGWCVLS